MQNEELSAARMWDNKFSREGYFYGFEPNAFIESKTSLLVPKGKVLCLGEGEGRNAVYLADKGFNVTALDASPIGMTKALAMASKRGVSFKTELLDLEQWEPKEQYNAVVSSYLHLEEPLRTKAFRQAFEILKTNGYFIGEFFSINQIPRESGGPKKPSLLYTIDDLKKVFDVEGAKLIYLEECDVALDEGNGHQGDALVVRVIVQKA
ncbi:class I SAM-dependent methyltransferase [Sulfurimonas sp. MAG313]|nr:class I SAM-dependent methyltransferase [Sulfurimonas sp. MAG313]MDF1880959.1 class I SAM-dependent methyltransferase [Sulfurimonas sp. MAG313]